MVSGVASKSSKFLDSKTAQREYLDSRAGLTLPEKGVELWFGLHQLL
jgi:hypothetical protein